MTPLNIQARNVRNAVGSMNANNSARGSLHQLSSVMHRIRNEVVGLNAVWDDQAQKVFHDSFMASFPKIIQDIEALDAELRAMDIYATNVELWDKRVSKRLANLRQN